MLKGLAITMAMTTSAQQILKGAQTDGLSKIPEQYWELVGQYREELIRQAFMIVKIHEDAEDVVQETFCEVFCIGQKLSDAKSIRALLRRVNRNNALDRVRAKHLASRKMVERQQEINEKTFTTGGFSALELSESMKKVLETMPKDLRVVVEMRYWQQLSYKEISERLHIGVGTVNRYLTEASNIICARLQGQLEPGNSETHSRRGSQPRNS